MGNTRLSFYDRGYIPSTVCTRCLNPMRGQGTCYKCKGEIAQEIMQDFQKNIKHELTEAVMHSIGPVSDSFKKLPVYEGTFFLEGPDGELSESFTCPTHLKPEDAAYSKLQSAITFETDFKRIG